MPSGRGSSGPPCCRTPRPRSAAAGARIRNDDSSRCADSAAQPQIRLQRRVLGRVADAHDELAGIDRPAVSGDVPIAEAPSIEFEPQMLGFAGRKADLLEALEFAFGPAALR